MDRFFPTGPRGMLEIGNLQACNSRRTCVCDRSRVCVSSLSCLNPHASGSSCHSSFSFYRNATSPWEHGEPLWSRVSDGLHAHNSVYVQPPQPAASRLPLHTLIARRPRHRSALETLQQFERVPLYNMQLGTPAADSMDIAAAPAWLQPSIASGAGRDANLLLLQFRDLLLQFRGRSPRSSCTRALRRQFTHH